MDNNYKPFIIFSLFALFLGWLGFILALLGLFWTLIFEAYILLGIGILVYLFLRKKLLIKKDDWIAAVIILLFVAIFSLYATPTIFSGRDQGSISEAAIRLAQNHRLDFSTSPSNEFFQIYGPGKALNFPGFYYLENGNLTTQFPLPYISWLAIFYSIFGLFGLVAANAILFFIFAFSLYFLIKQLCDKKFGLLGLLLALTSFSFSWFYKFTLSENMALALVWLAIWELFIFIDKPGSKTYYLFLSTLGLLFFTRIEGILFFLSATIIIFSFKNTRQYIIRKKSWPKIIFPLVLFSLIFILNFERNFSFYQEMARAIFHSQGIGLATAGFFQEFYTLKVFILYGLISYLALGIVGIIYFLKKRNWKALIPLFFVLPSFIYLVDSNISADHPWMLRRFVFSVLPALILYSVLVIYEMWGKNKKIASLSLLVLLFFPGLPAFLNYFNFSENRNLLQETSAVSHNFANNDLILVDRLSSGDGWAMLSGPMNFMLGKNSVYFFNPSDLGKIDISKFNKIYLISPEENLNSWKSSVLGNRLSHYKNYSINTTRLDLANEKTRLPNKINAETNGTIFEIDK